MPSLSFISSTRTDRSFQIGLTLVIFFAVAEIFVGGFHYLSKMRPASVAIAPRNVPAPLPSVAPSAPPVALPIASPAAALTPPTSVASESERLLRQAQSEKDTASALARLQAASERDPKNAELLAEIASIYEVTQNFDRSGETWRRVLDIGPSAGALYEIADLKLKTGVPTSTTAMGRSTGSALDAGKPATVAEVAGVRSTAEGMPTGSVLGISEVTASETPDPDAETNLMLRIAVKKRPGAVVDHTKVKIQVYFYDTVGDNDIKLTDADVSYEWLTPNHDWADSNSETLAVTYIRSKSKAKTAEADLAAAAAAINPAKKGKPVKASPPQDSANRKYLGYIVRVYYNDQLQDKRAAPTKLITLFPPPYTAPPQ